MKAFLVKSVGVLITAAMVIAAVLVLLSMWDYYMEEPWTRDGRIRADVVQITPDVSGLITTIDVRDNQEVRKGDILFRIDPARFILDLEQTQANLDRQQVLLEQARREEIRYQKLGTDYVTQQKREQVQTDAAQQAAAVHLAQVQRDLAQLNLERTAVRATVNGFITNFNLRPGDYVATGTPVAALVDQDSFHVAGYFPETRLSKIHVGDPVSIVLMTQDEEPLEGYVESIAAGIEDRERTLGTSLMANVNPSFSWVRLAQRVPVRIALTKVPDQRSLVAGRTVSVYVNPVKP